jgi:hypothetical protein
VELSWHDAPVALQPRAHLPLVHCMPLQQSLSAEHWPPLSAQVPLQV